MGSDYLFLLIVAIVGFGGGGWLLWYTKRDKKRRDAARVSIQDVPAFLLKSELHNDREN